MDMRVLVIDDDPLVGAAIAKILKNYRVTFSQSATGALGRIQGGGKFGAIVCDVIMPGLSGIEFHAQVLRIAPELAHRMVFVSGFAHSPEIESFTIREGLRCVEKPVDPQELRTVLEQVTGEHPTRH